jgi:hypothetical protein
MSAQEMQALRDHVRPYAADGRFELYKLSSKFDNPEARLAHQFPARYEIGRRAGNGGGNRKHRTALSGREVMKPSRRQFIGSALETSILGYRWASPGICREPG